MIGPAGGLKTSAAAKAAEALGRPFHMDSMSEGKTPFDLLAGGLFSAQEKDRRPYTATNAATGNSGGPKYNAKPNTFSAVDLKPGEQPIERDDLKVEHPPPSENAQ